MLKATQRERVIAQLATKLGTTAVPLLGRILASGEIHAREAARGALGQLANELHTRTRVISELRAITLDAKHSDDAKVCALGLLSELGEHGAARFTDPVAIQRRSALALAAQLETPMDVANAADMMVRQLADRDVVQMLEVLLEVAPAAALRLSHELGVRLDIDPEQRAKIAAIVMPGRLQGAVPTTSDHRTRPTHVAVLVDADARIIVVATAKVNGEKRWRRWAVLIGGSGCIDDCLHEDATRDTSLDPTASLVANLCADGYRVASSELDHARTLVATAARRSVRAATSEGGPNRALASSYYLGRDLLDLADEHVVVDRVATPAPLSRALDLLAAGDFAEARSLLENCGPGAQANDGWIADWAGALGACYLALGDATAAVAPLERAIAAEPWPLHYWNLATALHLLGDSRGCHTALRRFVATSAHRTSLSDDPEQLHRLAHAERMVAELARIARLDRRRPRRSSRATAERSAKRKKR